MAAVYGSVGEYVEGEEEWALYLERLEQFFVANAVSEKGQRQAIFLSTIGPKTYKLLSTLMAPRKPAELKYELLTATLEKHFCPQPPLAVRRFKFHTRQRQIGESVSAYVAALRSLARYCEFKNSLEDMLRDRLVCGVNDAHIQKRLLGDAELTFEKAFAVAMGFEAAAKGAQEIVKVEPDRDKTVDEVHAVMKRSTERGQVNVFGVEEGTIQQVSVRTLNQCVIIVARKGTYKGHVVNREKLKGDKEEQSDV